jgi:hypothetical protein
LSRKKKGRRGAEEYGGVKGGSRKKWRRHVKNRSKVKKRFCAAY